MAGVLGIRIRDLAEGARHRMRYLAAIVIISGAFALGAFAHLWWTRR